MQRLFQAGRQLLIGVVWTQAGDVGFDPLGISSLIDVKWLREAELKHGRVCMLASTGMIVQDVAKFPGFASAFGEFLTDNNFLIVNLPISTLVGGSEMKYTYCRYVCTLVGKEMKNVDCGYVCTFRSSSLRVNNISPRSRIIQRRGEDMKFCEDVM